MSAVLRSEGGASVRATVVEKGGGKYEGRYKVPEGTVVPDGGATWRLAIELHGCGIRGSPFAISVSDGLRLRFSSAFDTNGVLHYIGTKGGTEPYRNPHEAGRVVARMSSVANGDPGKFVQHTHGGPVHNFTNNEANSWMSVDLGNGVPFAIGCRGNSANECLTSYGTIGRPAAVGFGFWTGVADRRLYSFHD